jgi:hypothetical protein
MKPSQEEDVEVELTTQNLKKIPFVFLYREKYTDPL